MSCKILKVPENTKIAVVGDIHEHDEQFFKLVDKIQPNENLWLVSAGDIYDKGFGVKKAEAIIDFFSDLNKRNIGHVIQGNHELKNVKKAKKSSSLTRQLAWVSAQPIAVCFEFPSGSKVLVVHGGVSPHHTWDDLHYGIETSFIRNLDEEGNHIKLVWEKTQEGKEQLVPNKPGGVSWHEVYDGRFGYIASGHEPQKDGVVKYYNYSCNLDTACYVTGVLSCQIFNDNGLDRLISVTGQAKRS